MAHGTNTRVTADGRRLRVLFLIDTLVDAGGAERFAVGLALHLPRDRIEPSFCYTRIAGNGPLQALGAAGISCTGLDRKAKWDVHRFWGLWRLLRKNRFDVLHSHKFGSNFWGTLIGRAARVPVVIAHEHTWAYQGNRVRAWLDGNVIGRLATRFVAVSPADAERMVSYEGVAPEKVVVLPTGYIPRPGSATEFRQELRLGPATPMVVTAVVLRPQKATEVLLAAHALVLAHIPDAQLVIAGEGDRRPFLEQRARELQLDGHVHFVGRRADVEAIVAAADVGVLSSDFEGLPLFTFECMANHTPLVATSVGGLPTVVDDGRTGMLVPPRDPRALSEAIVGLLRDPARREAIADAAWKRLEPFRIEAVAARFAELYEQLAAEVEH